jgi:Amt family ammonium transporter
MKLVHPFGSKKFNPQWVVTLMTLFMVSSAWAEDELSPGDTAWITVATALVLFMMIPGLAMFYAGLVRRKNVLSVFMQCFAITALISILWTVAGYSLAFDSTGMEEGKIGIHSFIGSLNNIFMKNTTPETLSGTIPEILFFVFQMTFAVITPGLIVGAFAERMKFSAVLVFTVFWVLFGYIPICHMVWGGDGAFFADKGVIDFAGGIVVHITAGVAALVACIMVGPRKDYGKTPMPPHNLTMTLTGTAMLWVGWFGFNGGSALAANGFSSMAIVVTQLSPCAAALVWISIERVKFGKPSALGFATGAIAGLAAITPAAGSVGPIGALAIGSAAGAICWWAAVILKAKLGYDDALDVVGVHGVGGLLGTLLVAVFGASAFGGIVEDMNIASQLGTQAFASAITIVYTVIVTFIILKVIDLTIGLRIEEEAEVAGLDISEHEEAGYDL